MSPRHSVRMTTSDTEFIRSAMPLCALTGRRGRREASPERVVLRLDWRPELCTSGGLLHGGAVMALADSAGGACAFVNLPEGATRHVDDRVEDELPRRGDGGQRHRDGDAAPRRRDDDRDRDRGAPRRSPRRQGHPDAGGAAAETGLIRPAGSGFALRALAGDWPSSGRTSSARSSSERTSWELACREPRNGR